jgi:adenylylsulfate kinase
MSGVVIWLTGLPSSGKSTLALAVRDELRRTGSTACVLDGDVIRRLVMPQLGYAEQDRDAFYERLSQLAAELARQGLIVLVPATAHRRRYRSRARALAAHFVEVWVTTSLAECRRRDTKGLFASSRHADLPGQGADYEEPEHADVTAEGAGDLTAIARIAALARAEDGAESTSGQG